MSLLAQNQGGGIIAAIFGLLFFLIYLAIIVAVIAGGWKMFAKAGQPGWGILIPIYNFICLLNIAGRPIWWIVLMLIPLVNIVVAIIVCLDVARNFGKGTGFAVGLILLWPVFVCILGFGDAQYQPVRTAD